MEKIRYSFFTGPRLTDVAHSHAMAESGRARPCFFFQRRLCDVAVAAVVVQKRNHGARN